MAAAADACHANGMKFKIYNTMRELSNRCREIWAMRAFHETYVPGPPVQSDAADWLQEHLGGNFQKAWSNPVHAPLFCPGRFFAHIFAPIVLNFCLFLLAFSPLLVTFCSRICSHVAHISQMQTPFDKTSDLWWSQEQDAAIKVFLSPLH